MSKHSHWHNIQLTKGKTDAKRAQMFAKFAKSIAVAARTGGSDPSYNFKLRMAVDAAKAVSMPKENIDRAIQRGAGGEDGADMKEVVYEGFAPGGVAFMIVCLTDNPTRTVAEVKHIVSKNGGSVGAPGSVAWMFRKKAVMTFGANANQIVDRDTFELVMIDAGADDITESDGEIQVIGEVKDFARIAETVEKEGLKPLSSGIEYLPKETVSISDSEQKSQADMLFETLGEQEDVNDIFTNET